MLSEEIQKMNSYIIPHKKIIHGYIKQWLSATNWTDTPSGLKCIPNYETLPNTGNTLYL